MADKAEAITTDAVQNKRETSGDQAVSVRALKHFHKDADMQGEVVGPESEPFDVPRSRAAQLRANGLIEYAKEGDAIAIHGESDAEKFSAKASAQSELSKLPANSRTTPLRNPEVKLADLK